MVLRYDPLAKTESMELPHLIMDDSELQEFIEEYLFSGKNL